MARQETKVGAQLSVERLTSGRRVRRSLMGQRRWWGLLFVAPVVLFFVVFMIYPIINGVYLSFTDFTLLRPPVWVGAQNYIDLLHDRLFLKSLSVTLWFVLGTTVPVWILSLLAALLFFQRFWGREFFKIIFFLPVLPPIVVVAIIWQLLLHPNGILTQLVGPLIGTSEIRWLHSVDLAPISMILVWNWASIPFFMLIWLAGLSGISQELRDSAKIDGANDVQSFLYVELPLLRPTAVLVAALSTIAAFQGFILQFVMSPDQGGPANATTTAALLVWKYGFQYFRMGDAAAISVILFIIILAVTALQLWLGRSEDYAAR